MSRNLDVIKEYKSVPSVDKNILFSITNISDKDFIQKIIDVIPPEYTIHFIGYFDRDSFVRTKGNIIYHGFVNISDFFEKHHFDMIFSRGGYATMNGVARNIPSLCLSSDKKGFYVETLSRNNFIQMSNNNFVTRKPFVQENLIADIEIIKKSPADYKCCDLLEKYNNIECMSDIYKGL